MSARSCPVESRAAGPLAHRLLLGVEQAAVASAPVGLDLEGVAAESGGEVQGKGKIPEGPPHVGRACRPGVSAGKALTPSQREPERRAPRSITGQTAPPATAAQKTHCPSRSSLVHDDRSRSRPRRRGSRRPRPKTARPAERRSGGSAVQALVSGEFVRPPQDRARRPPVNGWTDRGGIGRVRT